jgi:hypothetical protein
MSARAIAGGPGFLERWGLALAAPRAALRLADDPAASGRAAGDLLRAIVVVLIVAHTRELVAAAWIAGAVSWRDAWPGLMRAVSGAAMFGLVFVVVATPVVSLCAGARRHLGRDFDLGCVAALVPVTVSLVATLVARTAFADGGLGPTGRALVLLTALGWSGAITALAIAEARRRS